MTRRRVLRGVYGLGYGLMAAFGLGALLERGSAVGPDAIVDLSALAALGLGAGGWGLLLVEPWVDRRPREPVLGTAPSGAPAVCFPRSPAHHVARVVFFLYSTLWFAAVTVVVTGRGQPGWGAVWGVCALAVLWRLANLVTGRIRPGGLWLTPDGIEYRKDAFGWAMPWTELQEIVVDRSEYGTPPPAPVLVRFEQIGLILRRGAVVPVRRYLRWSRDEQHRFPDRYRGVTCFGLAGGRPLIADTLEHYLLFTELRDHLGTTASVPRRAG